MFLVFVIGGNLMLLNPTPSIMHVKGIQYVSFFRWPVIVGFPTTVVERLTPAVHGLHCLEEPRLGCVQDCRPTGIGQAVGHPKESSEYELRQDVTCPSLLLPSQHTAESAGRATLLSVSRL